MNPFKPTVSARLLEARDPRTRHERKADALAEAQALADEAHCQANQAMLQLSPVVDPSLATG